MKTRVSLFKNVTARELLFDGYSDPLLTMGSLFAKPGGIPMDRFGWFYARNGRWESHKSDFINGILSPFCSTWSDGVVTMATGEASFPQLGDILAWNNATATPVYPGQCGQLRGTAAGFLHPDPDRQYIDFFSTDICRPIR